MRMMTCVILSLTFVPACYSETSAMDRRLEENALQAQEAIRLAFRYAQGWLNHADPETGLLPRNLTRDWHWNAKDCAADNYPFLALTAGITGQYHLKRAALHILEQEQRYANRLGVLPDAYDFQTRAFLASEPNLNDIIFGASEYVKDGLMPLVEWVGPSPWLDRMDGLLRSLWEQGEANLSPETAPHDSIEVCGELMQSMSRMYWHTGDDWYKTRCYRLADRYLLERPVTSLEKIPLRDHGCEIIGGLAEAYVIAARESPEKHAQYKAPLYALLDLILEKGVNEDGMMPGRFNVQSGEQDWSRDSDGWGYVYDAFLTVAQVDNVPRYQEAVAHALRNIHKYLGANWENGSADGYADSVEGALNLLNRLPEESAFAWVDESMRHIFAKQREDGVVEGWHGDGNAARTSLMYALWKTRGITLNPWREDMLLGALFDDAGVLHVVLSADWKWQGYLQADKPRHREYLRLPVDYPRINQMPEWFVAEKGRTYHVAFRNGEEQSLDGESLRRLPLALEPGQRMYLTITSDSKVSPPPESATFRQRRFQADDDASAALWQNDVRTLLTRLMGIADDLSARNAWAFNASTTASENKGSYVEHHIELDTRPDRRISVILTLPQGRDSGPFPAVVCIHGHGGTRFSVHDPDSIYHGFAAKLAMQGAVTLSMDVGDHTLETGDASLMGFWLFDLMRGVDYLCTLPEVDSQRIGCGGLSLGGELAMWLGALDVRIRAAVSAGFLTMMNQMERNHCLCWKFDGLREQVDFPDIYGLMAPRALMCQIGREEPINQFNTVIAEYAFGQIQRVYETMQAPYAVVLDIHPGKHEVNRPSMVSFLLGNLAPPDAAHP